MRLRRFGTGERGVPLLITTPFALHGPWLADFARGHSLVERLLAEGAGTLALLEWRSTRPGLEHRVIDDLLADLSLAIDDLGGRVDLVGLCQGGWLALAMAARHPHKVRRLVLAGAPVDMAGEPSDLPRIALATYGAAAGIGLGLWQGREGIVSGNRLATAWRLAGGACEPADALQVDPVPPDLQAAFEAWDAWTFDLPAVYLRDVIERLYTDNALARGGFVARGRGIDLSSVACPLLVLAGSLDTTTPPRQALAAASLVGTDPREVRTIIADSTHLGLFMGARTLGGAWVDAARWLQGSGRRRSGADSPSAGANDSPRRQEIGKA